MPVQRQELEILVKALSDPSVGRMAQEVVVSIKAIQTGLQSAQKTAQETQSVFQRMATGVTGFMRDMAATAAGVLVRDVVIGGLRVVRDAALKLGDALIETNAAFELFQTTIGYIAKDPETMAQYMDAITQAARESGRSVTEMTELAQPLARFAGGSSKALYELLKAMLSLQALKPQAGPLAAMIAITEALSGQFRSLQYRFEISDTLIKQLADDGLEGIELLNAAVEAQGGGWGMVQAQADTFRGTLTIIKGVTTDFFRILGEPVFKMLADDLRSVRDWLRENQDGIEALAQLIGTALADAYRAARDALADLIGVEEISLEDVVQWGMNFVASLVTGILDGVDRYLMPALISVASIIASFFAGTSPPEQGPLSDIDQGGAKMLEAYVDGILSSDAPKRVREKAEEIRRELLQEERIESLRRMVEEAQRRGAQIVEAAQRKVAAAQREVEEATKRVQAAQERLNEFSETHAETPERFLRARKRQLEAEIRAAQKEQQQKQDALKVAQEVTKAAQEQARAIVDAAREHEQVVKKEIADENKRLKMMEQLQKEADETGKALETGFTGPLEKLDINLTEYADKWKKMWQEAVLGPAGMPSPYPEEGRIESIVRQVTILYDKVHLIYADVKEIIEWLDSAAEFLNDLNRSIEDVPSIGEIIKGETDWQKELEKWWTAAVTEKAPQWVLDVSQKANDIIEGAGDIVGSVIKFFGLSEKPMEKAAKKTFYDPVTGQVKEAAKDVVGESIIPDMLDAILNEYERFRYDVWPIIEEFVEDVTGAFEELSDFIQEQLAAATEQAVIYSENMSLAFTSLTLDVNALRQAFERLATTIRQMPTMPQIPAPRVPVAPGPTGPTRRNLGPAALAGAMGTVYQFDFSGMTVGPGTDMGAVRQTFEEMMISMTGRINKQRRR